MRLKLTIPVLNERPDRPIYEHVIGEIAEHVARYNRKEETHPSYMSASELRRLCEAFNNVFNQCGIKASGTLSVHLVKGDRG